MTQAKIVLEGFNPDHDEKAIFTVSLPEQEGALAGTITIDFSSVSEPHKVTLEFVHQHMVVLLQSLALRVAVDMLDTHFDDSGMPHNEWSGDLLIYV